MAEKTAKRRDHEDGDDDSNEEWVGPLPSEASQPKKRKGYEVSAGTVPYPLLKTLQVRYRIPSATGMGYGNFR